jgi:hypothetical protein
VRFFEELIRDIEQDAVIEEQRQAQLVDVILRIDLERFFLHDYKELDHAKVERRIKFMLHPDKNAHCNAKDAFQRYCNCMSKWKSKRRSLSSLLLNTTPVCPVACAA